MHEKFTSLYCFFQFDSQVARVSKRGSREFEAGFLALDALHKQIMPFVLRRTKQQVLADLPPKIIQDVICDLAPLQARMYEHFAGTEAPKEVEAALGPTEGTPGAGNRREAGSEAPSTSSAPKTHVFQTLTYLRRLCSHPLLVLDPAVKEHMQVRRLGQRASVPLHFAVFGPT